MLAARADQQVLGYLGRALSLELSAVQLYSTQSRLVATWGLEEPAQRLRNEASEEMQHVERIIARMLAIGVAPNASQLRPVRLGHDLCAMLQSNLAFEQELVQLYDSAVRHCARAGDRDNHALFLGLLEDEQAHARDLGEWIRQLDEPMRTDDRRGGRGCPPFHMQR